MQILSSFLEPAPLSSLSYQRWNRDGQRQDCTEPILQEHHFCAAVTGGPELEFLCLPQHLPELIAGHLMTEGLISGPEQADTIAIDESGRRATVTLAPAAKPHGLSPLPAAVWKPEWVFALADQFADGMPLHCQTFATHSCFLARRDQLLFQCEDLGRHNALDKAVGFALLHRIPMAECILYSSGRMPVDMVRKAICAGIPVLASKGAPTAQAVALARQYGLTLLCAARRDSMKQFSGPGLCAE